MPAESAPSFDAVLRFLRSSTSHRAHDGGAADVETIETHMSWVFLVGDQVLKLKKPVKTPFLDFSTLAAREAACRDEVRLNSRLAPGVYLGLLALQWSNGHLALVPEASLGARAQAVEWLVWMRRLPAPRMLDQLIARAEVGQAEIDSLVHMLVAFYRGASRVELDPLEQIRRFRQEQALNAKVLLHSGLQLEGAARALEGVDQALILGAAVLQERVATARIVDGHGDLRPEHVCLLQPPVVIDCLEFNAGLRRVDPFDELSYLALECAILGAEWVGDRIYDGCAIGLGDRPPASLRHFYTAFRGVLRARLCVAHLLEPQPRLPQKWLPLGQRYLVHSLRALEAFRRSLALSGPTGNGSR